MRLISWDGMRDVSYENCHLVINPKTFEIEARTNNTDFEPIMGIYSTETKALKVMEMVRNVYSGMPIIMQNVEVTDEVMEMLKKQNVIYAKLPEEKSNIEYVNNSIFVFPKDEDVEV